MDWSTKTVCITGGAGFIGSHLVEAILAKNPHKVIVYDDFSRGSMDNLSQGRPDFHFYWPTDTIGRCWWDAKGQALNMSRADLSRSIPPFLQDSIVFHLAAKVTGIHYNISHSYEMMMDNLAINYNVARACEYDKPELVIWVSTACVYPHDAPVPTPEHCADVCDPEPTNWGYGVAKWVGEAQAKLLHKELGIPTIITRFFNAFGPRDYYDEATSHVAPALIKRVLDGEDPVTVWGSGNQSRVLVDARDIAKALVMLAESGLYKSGLCKAAFTGYPDLPWIVNIGHDREISIRNLVEIICNVSGNYPTIEYDLSRPEGYLRRAADTTKLRQLIGWVPDRLLRDTLHDMIADYKERYGT